MLNGCTRFNDWSASCVFVATLAWLFVMPPVMAVQPTARPAVAPLTVAILAYHRFAAVVKDPMTVRTATFRSQLEYLKTHGRPVISLHALVACLLGSGAAPPPRAVVITVDDGHESVFAEMLPIVREYEVPVTAFVYPSAISNASYAMTWEQLDVLHRSGLFDIQSHTYWHPNFIAEKRKLNSVAYHDFALLQLTKSRAALQDKLGVTADLIAWPFGIQDAELAAMALETGYVAGFTIERRLVTPRERIMALPRFIVTDAMSGRAFSSMLPPEQP
jgi:peptidoglycan/xylan/chitin deacetylase (PgdA/CDA1 family)